MVKIKCNDQIVDENEIADLTAWVIYDALKDLDTNPDPDCFIKYVDPPDNGNVEIVLEVSRIEVVAMAKLCLVGSTYGFGKIKEMDVPYEHLI